MFARHLYASSVPLKQYLLRGCHYDRCVYDNGNCSNMIAYIYAPPIRPRLMALYKCALIDWLIINSGQIVGERRETAFPFRFWRANAVPLAYRMTATYNTSNRKNVR